MIRRYRHLVLDALGRTGIQVQACGCMSGGDNICQGHVLVVLVPAVQQTPLCKALQLSSTPSDIHAFTQKSMGPSCNA